MVVALVVLAVLAVVILVAQGLRDLFEDLLDEDDKRRR